MIPGLLVALAAAVIAATGLYLILTLSDQQEDG